MNYRSYIYQPIPKTGCTTMRKAVSSWDNLSIVVDRPHGEPVDHAFERYCDIGADKWSKSFKFTFVRNPFSRMVSAWCYLGIKKTFNEFVKEFLTKVKVNNKETYISNSPEFHVSSYFCSKFHIQDMNYIGRTEKLQEDFNTVCDKIGIPKQKLPHSNKTDHKHYTKYYDEETKQIVAEKFAKDIEYFGYKFED